MSPHPLATWVQMSVATRREAQREHRRRSLRVVLARRRERAPAEPVALIPAQRRRVLGTPAPR